MSSQDRRVPAARNWEEGSTEWWQKFSLLEACILKENKVEQDLSLYLVTAELRELQGMCLCVHVCICSADSSYVLSQYQLKFPGGWVSTCLISLSDEEGFLKIKLQGTECVFWETSNILVLRWRVSCACSGDLLQYRSGRLTRQHLPHFPNYCPSQVAEMLPWSTWTREKEASLTSCVFPGLLAPVCAPWGQIFIGITTPSS